MMDFTTFATREQISALTWLGRKDWLDFHFGSYESKSIWTRLRPVEVGPKDKNFPKAEVEKVLFVANKDTVGGLFGFSLSKALSGGPKIFIPSEEDCEALENTECTMSFQDYKQPYPVVIIEFPKEYKRRLAKMWGVKNGPSHVIAHHCPEKSFIAVYAVFDRNNVIGLITPMRPEYKTIEDAIVKTRKDNASDIQAAELAQRLAMNFCMVMVLLGVRQTGPLDPKDYEHAKKLSRSSEIKKAILGKKLMESTLYRIEFINQKIKLYDEETVKPRRDNEPGEPSRISPKPHWRRGHYRKQRCGPNLSEEKLLFIKPVLVRADLFGGTPEHTEVIYKVEKR